MSKRRELVVLVAIVVLLYTLVIGIGLLFSSAEADCVRRPVQSTSLWNYDDDETATYVKIYDKVTKNCDGTYSRVVSLRPNKDKNRRISCKATRAFVFNPSSVYGRNPATFRAGCDSDGFRKSWRWRPSGTDRSFNISGHADKCCYLPDPRFVTRTNYAWRR